jgi:hypothetical protein
MSSRKYRRERRFDRVWYRLSAHGLCDSLGGAEYRRIKARWRLSGRPAGTLIYILKEAQKRPPRPEDKGVQPNETQA